MTANSGLGELNNVLVTLCRARRRPEDQYQEFLGKHWCSVWHSAAHWAARIVEN